MYDWRKMSPSERSETLERRKLNRLPWHSLPHRISEFSNIYLFTAACYEHKPIIGETLARITEFEKTVLEIFESCQAETYAWSVLLNHYHILAAAAELERLLFRLGRLHGRLSFQWNGEDQRRGRKVWCNVAETAMKSERHFLATLNYVHHNPVKHGYVQQWGDWPFSSAALFLESVGREKAEALWKEYPIGDYGKGWDEE